MCNNFICTIFSHGKCFLDRFDRMTSVCISSYIFIDTLHSDLQSGAAIGQHIRKMPFPTEIRSCFNGDADAFSFALFGKENSLFVIIGDMSAECIMEISDEVVSVLLVEGHKSSSHYDEFYLIHVVTDFLQLLDPIPRLNVGVVPCPDGSH